MQTNIQDFVDYVQCGKIFKPPRGNYQCPYILKCFQCKKIFLLFEAFIFHIEDDCKNFTEDTPANNKFKPRVIEVHSEAGNTEVEDNNILNIKDQDDVDIAMEKVPLTGVKSDRDLKSFDFKVNDTSNAKHENKLATMDLCETDSVEFFDNSDEDLYESSGEDMENIFDNSTDEENQANEIKEPNDDLDSRLESNDFITKFLSTKEYVTDFIKAYKRQPALWNKNFPYLITQIERQNCFEAIANVFNEKHDLCITWSEVKNLALHLWRTYREDLKYIKEAKERENVYAPSWFFKHLHFLKPFIERYHIAKLDSHMLDLLPHQIIQILKIYREHPHLWDTQLIEHYCKNKIDDAKQSMLLTVETNLCIKINENVLEKYIRTIHDCFKRAKRKELDNKSETNNSGISGEGNTLEDYYEHMGFLKEHVGCFKCSECDRSFKKPSYLKIHQSNVHGFEPLPCSQCKKTFKSVTAYTNHAKRHMDDFNYTCKECDKKYLSAKELEIHMRNHTGVKPYCCEICGASFRHIQGFTDHHRRHIKNYLHKCEICGKGFYTKERYTDHMNSHSNTRNQVCKVCGKAFITKRSLQQHVVIHEDVRRYSCKICDKAFKQKTGVNQHMRTHGITNTDEKNCPKKE